MIIHNEKTETIIDNYLQSSSILDIAPDLPEQIVRTIVFDQLAADWPTDAEGRQKRGLDKAVDAVLAPNCACTGDRRDMLCLMAISNEIVDRLLAHGLTMTMQDYLAQGEPEGVKAA